METGPQPEPYKPPSSSTQSMALSEVAETEASRPTGLTVLAVMNFIFGASAVMSGISSLLMLPFWDSFNGVVEGAMNQEGAPEFSKKILAFTSAALTKEAVIVGGILSLITGPLLLISGAGYLRQQKIKGRRIGNIYAIIALIGVGFGYIFWNLGMLNLVELIYPAFTLVLLNSVFKNDFVN